MLVWLWISRSVSSSKSKDEVKGGLLLDVVISEGATVLELLSSEDETLLIRRDALLVLDLLLDLLDGVGSFDLKGDGLACEGLDEDLHCCWWCAVVCWWCWWMCLMIDCFLVF